jgi:hypothetical protein
MGDMSVVDMSVVDMIHAPAESTASAYNAGFV